MNYERLSVGFRFAALVAVGFCCILSSPRRADAIYYSDVDGSWNNADNWLDVPEVFVNDQYRSYLPGTPASMTPNIDRKAYIYQGNTVTIPSGTDAEASKVGVGGNPPYYVLYPSLADAMNTDPNNDSWRTVTLPSHLVVASGATLNVRQWIVVGRGTLTIEAGASVSAESVPIKSEGSMIVNGTLVQHYPFRSLNTYGTLEINDGAYLDLQGLQVRGVVTQNGGDVLANPRGVILFGEYNMFGGTLTTERMWGNGRGPIKLSISGGTVNVGGDFVDIDMLELTGGLWSIQTIRYLQNSGEVLSLIIDDTGLSTIEVVGDISFAAGALLDVEALPSAAHGEYTLATWGGSLLDDGLAFAPGVDTGMWSFDLNPLSKTLTVTYVPEPSTLALLAAGALALARRKRSSFDKVA